MTATWLWQLPHVNILRESPSKTKREHLLRCFEHRSNLDDSKMALGAATHLIQVRTGQGAKFAFKNEIRAPLVLFKHCSNSDEVSISCAEIQTSGMSDRSNLRSGNC
jgi:hypothetical protein